VTSTAEMLVLYSTVYATSSSPSRANSIAGVGVVSLWSFSARCRISYQSG
jgi:hypothetical protein